MQANEFPILSPVRSPENAPALKTGFRGNKMSPRAANRGLLGSPFDLEPISQMKGKYKADPQMRQTISYFNEHIDKYDEEQNEDDKEDEPRPPGTSAMKGSPWGYRNQTKNPYAIRGQAQRQTMNKTVLSPFIQRDQQVHTAGKNAKILNKPNLIDGKTLDTK